MPIHTFGDSHSYYGWSEVIVHRLGAVLCYSFGNEKLNRCDIRNFNPLTFQKFTVTNNFF